EGRPPVRGCVARDDHGKLVQLANGAAMRKDGGWPIAAARLVFEGQRSYKIDLFVTGQGAAQRRRGAFRRETRETATRKDGGSPTAGGRRRATGRQAQS